MLKIDQGSLHVYPHRFGAIFLENSFTISRADGFSVLPRDIAPAPEVGGDLQPLLCGSCPDGRRLLPEVDVLCTSLQKVVTVVICVQHNFFMYMSFAQA